MKNKFKFQFIDDNIPIAKHQGTFKEIEKIFDDIKIKYKGKK
jgi:hypothetical protein